MREAFSRAFPILRTAAVVLAAVATGAAAQTPPLTVIPHAGCSDPCKIPVGDCVVCSNSVKCYRSGGCRGGSPPVVYRLPRDFHERSEAGKNRAINRIERRHFGGGRH